jgi:hypothetical protein
MARSENCINKKDIRMFYWGPYSKEMVYKDPEYLFVNTSECEEDYIFFENDKKILNMGAFYDNL